MRFAIFADLSRPLTEDEQDLLFAALDDLVPDSGCIGPNRHGDYEVFFTVDAKEEAAAQREAARYMDAVIKGAGVTISYVITTQPMA